MLRKRRLEENFGAIAANYHGGMAGGVSSFRSTQPEHFAEYLGDGYPSDDLDQLFGSDLANKIRYVRGLKHEQE